MSFKVGDKVRQTKPLTYLRLEDFIMEVSRVGKDPDYPIETVVDGYPWFFGISELELVP